MFFEIISYPPLSYINSIDVTIAAFIRLYFFRDAQHLLILLTPLQTSSSYEVFLMLQGIARKEFEVTRSETEIKRSEEEEDS